MTSELSRLTRESAKANMTFLVGHYPMSVVNMADPSIVKSVLKYVLVNVFSLGAVSLRGTL